MVLKRPGEWILQSTAKFRKKMKWCFNYSIYCLGWILSHTNNYFFFLQVNEQDMKKLQTPCFSKNLAWLSRVSGETGQLVNKNGTQWSQGTLIWPSRGHAQYMFSVGQPLFKQTVSHDVVQFPGYCIHFVYVVDNFLCFELP